MIEAYIFAYGSLVSPEDWLIREINLEEEPSFGYLAGYQRTWNIAFRNDDHSRDHKYYVDASGKRLRGYVAGLGLEVARRRRVFGLALPVNSHQLEIFDRRELAYRRSKDLRSAFSWPLRAPLYTYLPKKEAQETFWRALRVDNVFLPADYYQEVYRAFRRLGYDRQFEETTSSLRCPLLELRLVRKEDLYFTKKWPR